MNTRLIFRTTLVAILFTFYVVAESSNAQQSSAVDELLQIGYPQNALMIPVPMGQVDLSNGNLHLEIPLRTISQRANSAPITIKWVYDSTFWQVVYNSCVPNSYCESWWQPMTGGWRLVVSPSLNGVSADETWVPDSCDPQGYSTVPSWSNFTFTDSNGTTHLFPTQVTQYGSCSGGGSLPPYTYGMYNIDGSGYYMALTLDSYGGMGDGSLEVWDPSGNIMYNGSLFAGGSYTPGPYEDANGNIPESALDSNYATEMTPDVTITNSGYDVNTNLASVNGAFQYDAGMSNVASITLPDGSKYSFGYDQCPNGGCQSTDYHYGELTQMTLPTGATVTFGYQNLEPNNGLDLADIRVTSVSYSGESLGNCAGSGSWSGQTWSICYQLTSPFPQGTTEVDVIQPPDQQGAKNEIVYTGASYSFQRGNMAYPFFPTSKNIYQGLAQGGSLWEHDSYSYSACCHQLTGITTQINGQGTLSTGFSYWSDGLPMLSTKKEYDANGAVVRETDLTYTNNLGPGYYATYNGPPFPHFIDHPQTAKLYGPGGSSGSPVAQATYYYDSTSLSNAAGTISGQSVVGLSTHDDVNFGLSQNSRGNLTAISMMTSPGNFITTKTNYYNILGELIQTTDTNGHSTSYDYYSPSWGDSSCASYTAFNYPFLTQDALGHETKTTFNSCVGNVHSTQDQNDLNAGGSGTVYTYDGNDRLSGIAYPDGGSRIITHSFTSLPASETISMPLNASTTVTSKSIFDGLGRTVHKIDAAGNTTDLTYTTLGQVATVSNPHGIAGASTDGTTSYFYDPLGRVVETLRPDGTAVYSCYSGVWYSAVPQPNCSSSASAHTQVESWIDLTDEAGNHSQQASDALGRLVSVMEQNPTGTGLLAETDYSYDAANNLTGVSQLGNGTSETPRNRNFSYDSLSRLISASNPETGTVSYGYLNNGQPCAGDPSLVCTKTDGRGQTAFAYDALNRITDKYYSDGQTPNQHFRYDQSSVWMGTQYNTIGRLSESITDQDRRYFGNGSAPACNPQSSATANYNPAYGNPTYCNWTDELYSYDAMGRVARIGTAFPSEAGWSAHETDLGYDLAGNATSLRYPDGRVVTQGIDSTDRLQNVVFDNWNGQHAGYAYASGFAYTPAGAQAEVTYGNGVYIHTPYNNRGQMCQVWSQQGNQALIDTHIYFGGSTNYCTGAPGNNGNITQIKDWRNPNRTRYFGYDGLNRLTLFSTADGLMQQTYGYDSFGNLTQSGTLNFQVPYDQNNRLSYSGYGYDAAGNLTTMPDALGGTDTLVFDAADRFWNFNNSAATYTYDALGDRMRKDANGDYTEYQYLNGVPIAEKHPDGNWSDYIYANGQRIARADDYDVRIILQGTFGTNGEAAAWTLPFSGYTVKANDKICWRQASDGGRGGVSIQFTNGVNTNWVATDQDGQIMNDDTNGWYWHARCVDLSSYAGDVVSSSWIGADTNTPAGSWTIAISDLAVFSSDGTVTPIYWREPSISLSYFSGYNVINPSATVQTTAPQWDMMQTMATTSYFTGDQIGSARMITSGGGWPVYSDTFYPFGQEQAPTSPTNHFKFTGNERDAESGNDYFGARYYNSSMGRFMNPGSVLIVRCCIQIETD